PDCDCGSCGWLTIDFDGAANVCSSAAQVFQAVAAMGGGCVKTLSIVAHAQLKGAWGVFDRNFDKGRPGMLSDIVQDFFEHWKKVAAQFEGRFGGAVLACGKELKRNP